MASDPVPAWIALGANLGNARAAVRWALAQLNTLPGTRVLKASSLYRSAPVQAQGPDFINAVAEIETICDAMTLLAYLQALETQVGRERPYVNAPRTLDLDLLFYGDTSITSPTLTVPHPRWSQRAFVLLPLHEIAPQRVNAVLLANVADQRIERLPG